MKKQLLPSLAFIKDDERDRRLKCRWQQIQRFVFRAELSIFQRNAEEPVRLDFFEGIAPHPRLVQTYKAMQAACGDARTGEVTYESVA